MDRLAGVVSVVSLMALAGCGPSGSKRSPMVQQSIDQCVAGMAGVIPDEQQRKIVCECTADAQADPKLDGDATAEALDKCREKAGMDPNDPFGILNDEGS